MNKPILELVEIIEKESIKFHFPEIDAIIEAEYEEDNGYDLRLQFDGEDSTTPGSLRGWAEHIIATAQLMDIFEITNLDAQSDDGNVLYWEWLAQQKIIEICKRKDIKYSTLEIIKVGMDLSLGEMSKRYKTDNIGECYFQFFKEKYNVKIMTDDQLIEYWGWEFGETINKDEIPSLRKVFNERN